MSYKKLYDLCQQLSPPVSRRKVREYIRDITGRDIAFAVSDMDPKIIRGMFLSIDSDNVFARRDGGSDVVVISRSIFSKAPGGNYCWDRFVTIKEMMHIFDNAYEASDTGEKFDKIISTLFQPANLKDDPIVKSEIKCFWRALGVICPEQERRNFMQKIQNNKMTKHDIALKLRIPEQYINHLLSAHYPKIIEDILCN